MNGLETKLLTLALDRGAYPAEAESAAIMLIRKLRARNASIDEFAKPSYPAVIRSVSSNNDIMPFGKYRGKPLAEIPVDYLLWVLANCQNITPKLRRAIIGYFNDENAP